MAVSLNNDMVFYALFLNGGAGAAGLGVTVNIYNPLGVEIISGAAAVEIDAIGSPGLYRYILDKVYVSQAGKYLAYFKTAGIADNKAVVSKDCVPDWVYRMGVVVNGIKNTLIHTPVVQNYFMEENITIKRTAKADWEMRHLGDLSGRTALYFTVKKSNEVDSKLDYQAVIQINESIGLLVLDGAAASDPSLATITVLDAISGHIQITIEAEATKEIDAHISYKYDIKMDDTVLIQGNFYVESAVTLTI